MRNQQHAKEIRNQPNPLSSTYAPATVPTAPETIVGIQHRLKVVKKENEMENSRLSSTQEPIGRITYLPFNKIFSKSSYKTAENSGTLGEKYGW